MSARVAAACAPVLARPRARQKGDGPVANPLTLILPLKEGVDLEQLGGLIAMTREKIEEAMTTIGTVHYARFVVFDASTPNLQPGPTGPYKLAIITTFDDDFDAYIQDFVTHIGTIFDALMSVTSDADALVPVNENVAAFTAYVARNDASRNPPNRDFPFFNAYPCTVQQVLAAEPCPEATAG
jgi:hypothetical protein